MTITRRYQTGFDMGGATVYEIGTIINSIVVNTTAPKTGSYAMEVGFNQSGLWTIPATSQMRFGFHFRYPPEASDRVFAAVADSSGNVLGYFHVQAGYANVRFVGGGSQVGSWMPSAANTYYHFGLDVKKDASAGWWNWYFDGVLAGSFSGNTAATQIARVYLGTYGGSNWTGTGKGYYDNLVIDDTAGEGAAAPVPIKLMRWIPSNGNGNYSGWTGSDGNSVDNYALVDEVPANTTDYVVAASSGLKDSYNLADYAPSPGYAVSAVIPTAVALKGDATETQLKLGTRLSSIDLVGSAQNLPTAYGFVKFERQTTKPGGGSWSESDVDSAEVYIESAGSYA